MSKIAKFTKFASISSAFCCVLVLSASRTAFSQDAAEPEDITLDTKDGVKLVCTYYKSSMGKDATPVVLLADWKDSRAVYDQLARRLQSPTEGEERQSFAVLTVDLRGHGDSTKQQSPRGSRTVDAADLGPQDMQAMVAFDMEAVRKFLYEKNDNGELNMNRVSIVGAGLGASVAVAWADADWRARSLPVRKQGQDVKALVLISPKSSFKGLQMNKALRFQPMCQTVSFLIMFGSEQRSYVSDAKRLEKQLERYHEEDESLGEGEPQSLALIGPKTELQGTKFLMAAGEKAENAIIKFLTVHVTEEDFAWSSRKLP